MHGQKTLKKNIYKKSIYIYIYIYLIMTQLKAVKHLLLYSTILTCIQLFQATTNKEQFLL